MPEQDTQITRDGDEFTVPVECNGFGGGITPSLFMTMEQMHRLRAALEGAGA